VAFWSLAACLLALLPLLLALRNLKLFSVPAAAPPAGTRVSVLIPARDERHNIGPAIAAALASGGVTVEVLVLDDQSGDGTAQAVRRWMRRDARVRLLTAPPLPRGWAGKQRACTLLAAQARYEILLFVDADVRLHPPACACAAALLLSDPRMGLVSGFPREVTGSMGEHLLIPWIHVLLLGYLPMDGMRRCTAPAFGAGCGQLMAARREAYAAAGGHAAAPQSRHDGTTLPRSFRAAGWRTDVFDATTLAHCRMYRGLAQTWHGLGKSAGEGMATPGGLPVWTLLLGGGHVLPWVILPWAAATGEIFSSVLCGVGVAANLALRLLLSARFRQHGSGVLLHPIGALLLLALQWTALLRHLAGGPSRWRGREYVRLHPEWRGRRRDVGADRDRVR
jgi:hypothetical protein